MTRPDDSPRAIALEDDRADDAAIATGLSFRLLALVAMLLLAFHAFVPT